jgi:hypothetical protein
VKTAHSITDFIADMEEKFEGETTLEEARKHLGADDDDRIPGMKTKLKPHQLLGAWPH